MMIRDSNSSKVFLRSVIIAPLFQSLGRLNLVLQTQGASNTIGLNGLQVILVSLKGDVLLIAQVIEIQKHAPPFSQLLLQ